MRTYGRHADGWWRMPVNNGRASMANEFQSEPEPQDFHSPVDLKMYLPHSARV
jgi:hypothetical protein